MENSKIEWCDHTFNPWEGCTKVSPGCAHCYAEARNERFRKTLQKATKTTKATKAEGNWGKGKPRRRTSVANWKKPLIWNERRAAECAPYLGQRRARVFCLSIGDVLDEEVPIGWLADLLRLIYETPNLDWLLLTKRPGNFKQRLEDVFGWTAAMTGNETTAFLGWLEAWLRGTPPQNVWMGTSVEDQERAERIIELLDIPAAMRFLSVEPMLEAIDLDLVGRKIDWVIFGGESGIGARDFNLEWMRDGNRQCRAAGVKIFNKQLGARPQFHSWLTEDGKTFIEFGENRGLKLKDKKGGEMSEWPEDLRIREFPAVRAA